MAGLLGIPGADPANAGKPPRLTTTTTTTTVAPTTTTTVPGPVTTLLKDLGVQTGGLTRAQTAQLLDKAKAAGASVVSGGVNFAALEPTGPAPAGEWTSLDTYVADAAARGLRVRLRLHGLPDWARDRGRPSVSKAPWLAPQSGQELGHWSAFLTRLVSRFGTTVAYYEIWNEENGSDFWYGGPSPSSYASLLQASYTAIKAAAPGATVVFGGLSRNDLGFLQQVYAALDSKYGSAAAANRHYFDILSVHPYTLDRSPTVYSTSYVWNAEFGVMDENFTGFNRLKEYMTSRGEGAKRIYIGEYGFPTEQYAAFPAVPDATRADYLRSAFSMARATGVVEGLSWYYLYPTPWDPAAWTLLDANWNGNLTFDALVSVPNS